MATSNSNHDRVREFIAFMEDDAVRAESRDESAGIRTAMMSAKIAGIVSAGQADHFLRQFSYEWFDLVMCARAREEEIRKYYDDAIN